MMQGIFFQPIAIPWGTRQGSLLSPLIFAIAIQTLAIASQDDPDIPGVYCGTQVHRCGLFVDNLFLFVTSRLVSAPNILRLLWEFGTVSGTQLNVSKSMAPNVTVPNTMLDRLKEQFPFI